MFTQEVIITLLNSAYRWDIIDAIIEFYPQAYYDINAIYDNCIENNGEDYILLYKNLGLIANSIMLALLLFSKYRLSFIYTNEQIQHQMYLQYQRIHRLARLHHFMNYVNKIGKQNTGFIEIFSFTFYLQKAYVHIFKTPSFQDSFNKDVSQYILTLLENDDFQAQLFEILSRFLA